MGTRFWLWAAAACFLAPGWARAASHDINLNGTFEDGTGILFSCTPAPCEPDNDGFRSLATELAYVVAPRIIAPAKTLGHAGFDVGIAWAGSFVSGDDFWLLTEEGQEDRQPTEFLQTLQVEFRKGLPFSFEVGANVQWIIDSEMVAPGIDLRWAFHEGYDFLPDFALRAAVNTLLGTRDFDLTVASFDLTISESFVVGGLIELAPYVSWGFLLIHASTGVVDPTPTEFVLEEGVLRPDVENDIVFETVNATDDLNGRLTFGLRTLFSIVELAVQGELQMFSQGDAVGPVATIAARVGLQY
ncbi:MAG: hypothetical protein ACFB9M_04730 [Myxococcota bacterium]